MALLFILRASNRARTPLTGDAAAIAPRAGERSRDRRQGGRRFGLRGSTSWVLLGVVLGGLLLACSRQTEPVARGALTLPEGARQLQIEDPEQAFRGATWLWLAPPVRLPSNREDLEQVVVAVSVPEGSRLRLHQTGAKTGLTGAGIEMVFPPGSQLERLEWLGRGPDRYLADVRGARIDADGSVWHHNLRSTAPEAGAPLIGVEWQEGDDATRSASMEVLIQDLAKREPWKSRGPKARDASFDSLRKKAECGACHVPARADAERRAVYGVVFRGTDTHGFFTPRTIWREEVPVEGYGAFDRNLADLAHWLDVRCGPPTQGAARSPATVSDGRFRCADQRVPWARLDLSAARAAGSPHAAAVCETREWLRKRMDVKDLPLVDAFMRPCG